MSTDVRISLGHDLEHRDIEYQASLIYDEIVQDPDRIIDCFLEWLQRDPDARDKVRRGIPRDPGIREVRLTEQFQDACWWRAMRMADRNGGKRD